MPIKLKNPKPCPNYYVEYTYAETVEVRNGVAIVNRKPAVDYLLKLGYVRAEDEPNKVEKTPESKEAGSAPKKPRRNPRRSRRRN